MAIRLHPLLEPWKPTDADPWDRYKAAHLLQRAGFGGTPSEITAVYEQGPQKAVDALLDFPDAPVDEEAVSAGPDLGAIEGYPKNFNEIRKLYAGKTDEERKKLRNDLMRANREAVGQIMGWWLSRMAAGPYPLQEKLTLFWHGHFTTSASDERQAYLIWQQNELHRRMAAGNYRAYIRAISRDPAMLDYLNNNQNRKQSPNENYARELMELFTLGIGNYSEDDIKQAARAFTGWGHDGDNYVFRRFDHDTGTKAFFGKSGNFDGDDIIDIILTHKAAAPYIAGRMWRFFAYEPADTDTEMLASLGAQLRESDWSVRPALRTMLTSRAFYSERAMGTQIKSPIQLVVGTLRLLDLPAPPTRALYSALNQMGQVPLMPPNVKGWPGGRMWINTSTVFVRYNTAVWLAGGDIPALIGARGKRAPEFADGRRNPRQGLGVAFKPGQDPDLDSPAAVVDHWLDRLVQRPVSDRQRSLLIDALGKNPSDPAAVKRMIQLIVSTPEYQLC